MSGKELGHVRLHRQVFQPFRPATDGATGGSPPTGSVWEAPFVTPEAPDPEAEAEGPGRPKPGVVAVSGLVICFGGAFLKIRGFLER